MAYVNSREDRQLHKLNALNIRPGAAVKLHQTYPTYVIECEGTMIALDRELASQICLWNNPQTVSPAGETPADEEKKNGLGAWVKGLGSKRRGRKGKGPSADKVENSAVSLDGWFYCLRCPI